MANTLTLPVIKDLEPKGGIGSVSAVKPDAMWLYNRHMTTGVHIITLDDSAGAGAYVDVTTAAQSDTVDDVALVPAVPTVGDAFFTIFPSTRSISGHDITLSQAGSDITWAVEYWNGSTNTWTTVSNLASTHVSGGAEVAVNLMESADLQFIKFDEPTNIGVSSISVDGQDIIGKIVRFRVEAVGASPVGPRASKVYPLDATTYGTDITSLATGHSHPDAFSYGNDNNAFYLTSANKFVGYENLVWAIAQSNVSVDIRHEFWNGSAWVDMDYYATCATAGSETSTINLVDNTQTVTPREFTATSAGGSAISTEKLIDSGFVSAVVDAIATASTDRAGIGLDRTTTGDIEFEMRKDYTGGNPRVVVYESGVAKYTHTSDTLATDELKILLYKTAGDSARTVSYIINGTVVYTSAEVIADTDSFYARIVAVDNAATFTEIRMVDMQAVLGQNIDPTLTGTNATITNAAPVSEEVVQKQIVYFKYTDAWVAHTAATSPTGVAGYNMRQRVNDKQGTLIGSNLSSMSIIPVTTAALSEMILATGDTFTREIAAIDVALESDVSFFIVNLSTGSITELIIPANGYVSNTTTTVTLPGSDGSFAVLQASMQEQSDVFMSIVLSN